MRVLIVNSLYHPNEIGGAERSVQALAEGLAANNVHVAVLSSDKRNWDGELNGVTCYYRRIPNLYWMKVAKEQSSLKKPIWHALDSLNPFTPRVIKEVVDKERPGLIHTHNLAGLSVSVWRTAEQLRLPIVHTLRDHYLMCPRAAMFKNDQRCPTQCFSCRIYSSPRRNWSQRVEAVIGVSRFILDRHLDYCYFSNARIRQHIYNPIASVGVQPRRKTSNIIFAYVGPLSRHKGVELLLDTFATGDSEAELQLFGKGLDSGYENYLRAKYRSERIRFIGFVPPSEIYKNVDVVIVPSLCDDAFPRVIIEALSHGLPVIASDRGGAREILKDSGAGLIFDPGKQDDLRMAMDTLGSAPEMIAAMGEKGRQVALTFSTDRVVDEYTGIYSRVTS
jgi:glycosyltransferase involved in cell wall biosynthesis